MDITNVEIGGDLRNMLQIRQLQSRILRKIGNFGVWVV